MTIIIDVHGGVCLVCHHRAMDPSYKLDKDEDEESLDPPGIWRQRNWMIHILQWVNDELSRVTLSWWQITVKMRLGKKTKGCGVRYLET